MTKGSNAGVPPTDAVLAELTNKLNKSARVLADPRVIKLAFGKDKGMSEMYDLSVYRPYKKAVNDATILLTLIRRRDLKVGREHLAKFVTAADHVASTVISSVDAFPKNPFDVIKNISKKIGLLMKDPNARALAVAGGVISGMGLYVKSATASYALSTHTTPVVLLRAFTEGFPVIAGYGAASLGASVITLAMVSKLSDRMRSKNKAVESFRKNFDPVTLKSEFFDDMKKLITAMNEILKAQGGTISDLASEHCIQEERIESCNPLESSMEPA